MGKRSKSVTFSPKSRVFAASFSGSSGHEFSAIAGPQTAGSSAVCSGTPDLDIVSGFAFLSFDSLDALELHIDVNEANTSSLSVQVGQKRPHSSCPEPFEGPSGTAKKSKRSPKPKPKTKKPKPKQDFELSLGIQQESLSGAANIPPKPLQDARSSTSTGATEAEGYEEISLLCPETLPELDEIREVEIPPLARFDVPLVSLGEPTKGLYEQRDALTLGAELLPKKQKKKKKKKKKKKEASCDQTSQTMFRIKKKKKKKTVIDLTKENPLQNMTRRSTLSFGQFTPESVQGGEGVAVVHIDITNSDDFQGGENPGESDSEIPISGNHQEVESPRSAMLKKTKIEKIEWCARSGGAFVMNKYRVLKKYPVSLFRIEGDTFESAGSTPEGSDLDLDIREEPLASVVKLEDNTLSETSSDEMPREFLFSNETFLMKREGDENEAESGEVEIDIESVNTSVSKNFIVVSGIKGTPGAPSGHFSFHPHVTREGTVDSSIQIYASEIEVYMKCAMLQHGEIIKVITPDKDDVEAKYLRDPDGLRAVRSLTERKRRTFLGQMFTTLKMEVFTDPVDRELYFSKQTILTKATATVDELLNQDEELNFMKAQLKEQGRVLREKLKWLVFGETARTDQMIDAEKLGSVLKHFNIEVEEPLDDVVKLSDTHTVKAPPPICTTTQTTQTPSAVCHEEIGYHALLKTPTVATVTEGITTTAASKPSIITAPKLVHQMITNVKSSQSGITPGKVTPISCPAPNHGSKIICNLSRVNTQRSTGNTSNICLVTNMNPTMKRLERKNVMHIKITNDVLKQVDKSNASAPEQQAKATPEPRNPTSAGVTCKPQVMLGTLIAKKHIPPTKKTVQLPSSSEPSPSQVRAKQSSGRHLRPILPHPTVANEVMAGISNIVNTVKSPSILQHLSLSQKSGSNTPIVFSRAQDSEELEVNEPDIHVKQVTSDPQPATGIDGLQGVVDKLSQEQQSLAMNTKILVPVKVTQAEVILLPAKLGTTGNMPNPISHLPSTFTSSVISSTQLGTARSPGFSGTIPNTQSSPSESNHGGLPSLRLILGRVSGIPISTKGSSRGNSATIDVSTLNTSSHTTSQRISAGVQSTPSLVPKTASQIIHGGNKPLSCTESVPTSCPLTVHSVPASTPGRFYVVSSQTARGLQNKVALVGQTAAPPPSTQGNQRLCATTSTMVSAVTTVSTSPGATQHRQMTIKLPLSNMQSPVLSPQGSVSCVIPLRSFAGRTGNINPNLVIAQLNQGAIRASTPSTSTVHYSTPNTQVKQSMFLHTITSPTTTKVNPGVPMAMCSPRVVQQPQLPLLESLQMHPESSAHSNIPACMTTDKPWITAHHVTTSDSLDHPGDQSSPSVQSSEMFPEILESILTPVNVPQAPQMEMGGSVFSMPRALPPSEVGNFSADIVWPQVPELAPVSHYTIPAVGGAGSLAQAEESSNIPSAFVTRIPVTDWRESVDIPYLVSGDSLEASAETANLPNREMTMGQSAFVQCEGDQLKEMQTNPRFDVRDHTYSKKTYHYWCPSNLE